MNKVGIYFAYWTREWQANYPMYIQKVARLGFDILEVCTANFVDLGKAERQEIRRAAQLGWIQGDPDGRFRPNAPITRAEAMTIINRVLNRLPEEKEDLLEGSET